MKQKISRKYYYFSRKSKTTGNRTTAAVLCFPAADAQSRAGLRLQFHVSPLQPHNPGLDYGCRSSLPRCSRTIQGRLIIYRAAAPLLPQNRKRAQRTRIRDAIEAGIDLLLCIFSNLYICDSILNLFYWLGPSRK